MSFFGHLLLCQIIKVTAVVLAVFTWVLCFSFQDVKPLKYICHKSGVVSSVFLLPILHLTFQQFLDFSSGRASYSPWKRRPWIVTGCLNVVVVWGWTVAEIWQGKGTLIGSAFIYSVNVGVVRRQWCPRCFPAILATFLPVLSLDLWSKWLIREAFWS